MATNDFLETLAQAGSQIPVVDQLTAIPEFLKRLIVGYKGSDVTQERKEKTSTDVPTKLKNKEGKPVLVPKVTPGGYPQTNQFMGENLQPFVDFGEKTYGKTLEDTPPVLRQVTQMALGGGNFVNAVGQRINLLKKAIETSPSLDVFADGLKQAGFELNNWKNFFTSDPNSGTTPFGEDLNYKNFDFSNQGEIPYSELKTEEAKFKYLKRNPDFTPPEWKAEDKKAKEMTTEPQWDIQQMFRTPRSPRVREGRNGGNKK